MKIINVRLPEPLATEIEAESRQRRISKSDVVRERLAHAVKEPGRNAALDDISDLIGSVDDDLPADLSARKKYYLRKMLYGRKRHR